MSEARYKGSCLCGKVHYELSPPFLFFHNCHCSRCRKTTGSAHSANLMVKAAQFAWTQGEDFVKRYEHTEAKYFCTGFCAECGSSLPWYTRNSKYVIVPAGTLDDDPGSKPDSNIYWDSRAPWYTGADDLPKHLEGD